MAASTAAMAGKTCLVTGGTAGIGMATARLLAELGATVVIVGRDQERCDRRAAELTAQTGQQVHCFAADLSSQREVRRLALQFQEHYLALHVLINNAGAAFPTRRESVDGIEMTWALNHLAPFLLTHLLLQSLKAGAPARVINVTSSEHRKAQLDFDDLQSRKRYNGMAAYRQSKLANILFTYELSRRLHGMGVSANAVSPGLISTRFATYEGGMMGLSKRFINALIGKSPEEGARRVVYLGTAPELNGVSGAYYEKGEPALSAAISYDKAMARRLWQSSVELTGLPQREQPQHQEE